MFRQFQVLEPVVALNIASQLQGWKDWEKGQARNAKVTEHLKHNEEINPENDDDPLWEAVTTIKDAVLNNSGIGGYVMPTKLTAPKFNRYAAGNTYRRHIDAPSMGGLDMRTDFACTITLNEDYEGGDLHLETWQGDILKAPRPIPGIATVYECGGPHWVSPVTKGERISAIIWMRSLIKDVEQRNLARRFAKTLITWETEDKAVKPFDEDYITLVGIQTALIKMWSDA